MRKPHYKNASFFLKKTCTLFIILGFCFLVFACSVYQAPVRHPKFKTANTTIAKDIKDNGTEGVPLNPGTAFPTQDEKIVPHISLRNLSGNVSFSKEQLAVMDLKAKYGVDKGLAEALSVKLRDAIHSCCALDISFSRASRKKRLL